MADRDLVLLTGITGFIGQHLAAQLIDRGWRVRGTLRDQKRSGEAVKAIETLIPGGGSHLEFAVATLERDAGWEAATGGVRAIMHVASPIPLVQPKDPNELVGPARDGALRVLAAATRSATVRKVVMTSSIAAIADGHGPGGKKAFTESDWSNPDGPRISPYARSKTIAERSAWEFIGKEKPRFAFSTVNPGLVLGPVLGKDYGVSPEVVRRLMAGEVPGAPLLGWETVDVRDVADLHVRALDSDAANGQRFIASSEFLWMSEMAKALRGALGRKAAKVPKGTIPNFVLRIMALFDPAIRGLLPELGRKVQVSHEKAERILGWRPRAARQSVIDTAESMVRHGVV